MDCAVVSHGGGCSGFFQSTGAGAVAAPGWPGHPMAGAAGASAPACTASVVHVHACAASSWAGRAAAAGSASLTAVGEGPRLVSWAPEPLGVAVWGVYLPGLLSNPLHCFLNPCINLHIAQVELNIMPADMTDRLVGGLTGGLTDSLTDRLTDKTAKQTDRQTD